LGLFLCGDFRAAVEKLEKGKDCIQKFHGAGLPLPPSEFL
jgi:hypothetical protein